MDVVGFKSDLVATLDEHFWTQLKRFIALEILEIMMSNVTFKIIR
jgi:hypothetical protein